MRNVVTIAANDVRRLVRQRTVIFFVFVLPLLLIVVLGTTVGGAQQPHVGILAPTDPGPLASELIDTIRATEGVSVSVHGDLDEATEQLQREELTALVIIDSGFDATVHAGGDAEIEYLVIPTSAGFETQGIVQSAIADQNEELRAARLLAELTGSELAESLATVRSVREAMGRPQVVTVDADGDPYAELPGFDQVAAQELILFMFLTGMTAAAALVQVRQLGLARRMLSTPASAAQILAGHALGRYGISLIQSLVIVVATATLFAIDWYSWPATLAVVTAFALISTAAAMHIGAIAANDNQSTAIGIALGLSTAAFGGCMVPLEVFGDRLRAVAHVTPHAWAMDAFTELQAGGGLAQIGTELAVLSGYGLVLLGSGALALSRTLTR